MDATPITPYNNNTKSFLDILCNTHNLHRNNQPIEMNPVDEFLVAS